MLGSIKESFYNAVKIYLDQTVLSNIIFKSFWKNREFYYLIILVRSEQLRSLNIIPLVFGNFEASEDKFL